jgi:DNA invertase Pin-like site-specific DNA recombinase
MTAVAYIRRSASGEAQASEKLQRETVERLAQERGDTISRVFRDCGRSGGAEDHPEYLAMLAEAEAGGTSVIYAYDQDRLAGAAGSWPACCGSPTFTTSASS